MTNKLPPLSETPFDAPIVVDFPGGTTREFRTLLEVAEFVDVELAAWDFLPKENNAAVNKFSELKQTLQRASEREATPVHLNNIATDLKRHLEQFAREMPLHGTVQFQFVKRAHEKYRIVRGIERLFPTTITFREDQFDRNDQIAFCMQLLSADKAYADEFQPQVRELQQEIDQLRALIKQERKNLDDLRADYRSISDTQEPANYWEEKSSKHLHAEKTWGLIAVAAAVAWLAVLGFAYWWVHGSIVEETAAHALASALPLREQAPAIGPPSGGPPQSKPIEISPWYLLSRSFPLVALSVCAFWSLRILIRNYLTNLHLRIDAQERVILTKTYQTLLKGDRNLNERGFEIILGQLFRHSQTGVMRDDAAPAHPLLDYATRPQAH